jgi:cysteine-S-conjugate beta-lyase
MRAPVTTYDFDQPVNRRGTNCAKHDLFDEDVVSMWVADMDFLSPEPVIRAMRERVEHGVFGYTLDSPELREVICRRMGDLNNWAVQPEEVVFVPGVIAGFNAVVRAFGQPGGGVLMQTPVYPPFLMAAQRHEQALKAAELVRVDEAGGRIHYEIDFDAFERTIDNDTKIFMLCSPHNPLGRVWRRDELARMAEICAERDILICSDEIHCDLLFDDHRHIPIASLSPEVARRTITLMSPSKTFNLPGLGCAFAIIQDDTLRDQYKEATEGIAGHVNILGFTAALAAYRDSGEWLAALLTYLRANREFTTRYITENLPGVGITHPEGTYLSWLDTRRWALPPESDDRLSQWIDLFFLKKARVALNTGTLFGQGGEGYTRLNFACPRPVLVEALERMRAAIEQSA